MMDVNVYTPHTSQARREKQMEQNRCMIGVLHRNAALTERYLDTFGACLSEEKHLLVANHLKRTYQTIEMLTAEYNDLEAAQANEQ